jgi:hypothetical protein
MHIAACSDASAETAADLVIAQINMGAARRADRGRCRAADLLFPLAFETLDNRTALSFPKILEPAKYRGTLRRGRFFPSPQLQAGFRRERRKRPSALATD